MLPLLHWYVKINFDFYIHLQPEMTVQVSVAQPLLSEEQLNESNLLNIHVDSAFSVPDAWQPGQQFIYTACLPVPITGEVNSYKQKENLFDFGLWYHFSTWLWIYFSLQDCYIINTITNLN